MFLGLPWWLRWYGICLQCRRPGFDHCIGKIPCRSSVFLPGEFHEQRSLVGYSAQGHKESNKTERLTFTFLLLFFSRWCYSTSFWYFYLSCLCLYLRVRTVLFTLCCLCQSSCPLPLLLLLVPLGLLCFAVANAGTVVGVASWGT